MKRKNMGQLIKFSICTFFVSLIFIAEIASASFDDSLLNHAPDEEGGGLFKWVIEANLRRDVFFSFHPDLIGVPGLQLDDFRIMENKSFQDAHPYLQPYAIGADYVSAHVNPFALFLGRISITDLEVRNPEVQFAVDDKLRTNFDDILEAQKSNAFINWIRVKELSVEDARVHIYTDIIFSKYQEFFLTDIDVKMNNIVKGKVANVDIRALSPGAEDQNSFVKGTVGPIVSLAAIEKSPMDLKLSVIDAPVQIKDLIQIPPEIEHSERLKKVIGLPEDGMANVTATITGDYDKGIVGDGTMTLTDVYLANLDNSAKGGKFNATINAKGTASLLHEKVDFEDVNVAVENSFVTMSGTLDNLLGNASADLKIITEGIDMKTVQKVYPFYQLVSGLEISNGNVSFDMAFGGTLEEGFTATGKAEGKDIQLYDTERKMKGMPLNGTVVITEKPVYHLRDSILEINEVDINIGSSQIKAKGTVQELLGVNRKMEATATSEKVNVPEIVEFVPFLKSLIPEGGRICGHMGFKCDVNTNVMKTDISGQVDFKRTSFAIEDFAEKQKGSKCTVDFKSSFDLDQIGSGEATVVVEDGIIHDPKLFTNALCYLMGNASKTAQGKKIISCVTDRRIIFKTAKIKGTYIGENKFNGEIVVSGVNPSTSHDMTIRLNGTLDLEGLKIDGKGTLDMAPGISGEILAVAKKAQKFIRAQSNGDTISLPFSTIGSLSSPVYKFGYSEGNHIAKEP